jgi:CHAD domain-containing protein
MSYELRHDEGIGDGLRLICRKQIDLALQIVNGEREPDDTPVHEVRKHIKKARAAVHLLKKEIGRGLFKRQDHCLRDVGRLISDIRDAEVRLQTVRQLQGIKRRQKRRSYAKVEELLVLELENFMAAFAEWQSQAAPMLLRAREELEIWSVEKFGPAQLCCALQQSYKCARQALAAAKASSTPEDFHAFRSKGKQLWYQLRLVRPADPVVLKNLTDELRAIGDLLGRAHDLSFLGDRLRQDRGHSAAEREAHNLLAVIEASESDLQRAAAELAERFFSEKPRNLGARVASWLKDWTEESSPSIADELAAGVTN